jgi:potassium efflux system protein
VRQAIVLLIALCISTTDILAAPISKEARMTSLVEVMNQQLNAEETRVELLVQRLDALQRAQHEPISTHLLTKQLLKRMTFALAMTEAENNNIELTLKTAQLEAELIQSKIHSLQRRSVDIRRHLFMTPEVDATLQEQYQLLEVQQKRIRVLQNTRDLLNKLVVSMREWSQRLQIAMQSAIQNQRQAAFYSLLNRLQNTQNTWINQITHLGTKFNNPENQTLLMHAPDVQMALRAIATEEKTNLIHIQLHLETISERLQQLSETLSRQPPLMILNTLQKPLEVLLNQLQTTQDLLQKKDAFLNTCIQLTLQEKTYHNKLNHVNLDESLKALQQLSEAYQVQAKHVGQLMQRTQTSLNLFTRQLHAYLGNRQDLPGLDMGAWVNLIQRLAEIPQLFGTRLINAFNLILNQIKHAPWWQSAMAMGVVLGWVRSLVIIKRLLNAKRLQLSLETGMGLAPTLMGFIIQVSHHYIYSIIGTVLLWNLLLIWKIPFSVFSWILNLIAVYLIFSIAIYACRFWLVESAAEEKELYNKKLYYRLRRVLRAGGIITVFSLIAHQVVLDYEVRNFVARLFMLFLLIIALVLFRIWAVIPKLLEGYWVKRPRYLNQVVRWVSFLLPMSLLLNAILGLVGYVQLAWAIVGYQSLLLLGLAIYPLIRGLLNELFNWLSEQSIRHFRNGWLWSEALLKPLYQLLKLCTLTSIILLLFSFAGWREQLFRLSTSPTAWLTKQLIVISDIPINALKIIEVIIMTMIVIWLARWTREFAYRWVFANLKDLGLRNSLSIFTQYMAVFLSILATFQIAGLTLSVLKYVLSGFAIGLSFGLRDLFNNFVTGVLLLVERPLKVGDWVTIGEWEGQVSHIGARAITINTTDHQELMVPNADLFYKQFINWTHHDSVVRISLPLSVNRKDDPFKVRELILEVVQAIPKILHHPTPQVYFKATDQMLLAFKVEYYVDLAQITSRSEVNSQFLFALWKRFEEAGITPPEVVHELRLQGQVGLENSSTKSFDPQHA